MVNIFVVHSGNDYNFVKQEIEPFLYGSDCGNYSQSSNILTLESGEESNWKRDALKKIKMSQAVIIVVGEDACYPTKKDTMGWEVKQSLKYNKLLMILNRNEYNIPEYLLATDRFSKQKKLVAKQMTLDEIKKRVDDYSNGFYNIFSEEYKENYQDNDEALKKDLIEQYKLFSKTSEDLVARRQTVNSFYIMVNSALSTIAGLVLGIVIFPSSIFVVMFMCVAGLILDISWIGILDRYGTLNAAKMRLIQLMEKQLPVSLYDIEWQIMSDKLNNKKYVSFTDSEKRIPKMFIVAYLGILVIMIIFFIVNIGKA